MNPILIVLFIVVLFAVFAVVVLLYFIPLWIQAQSSGISVPFVNLIMMRLRAVDPKFVIEHLITLNKAGIHSRLDDLEALVLAGGNLNMVVDATVTAHKAGLDIDFKRICAIDLSGRDIRGFIQTSVQPKVINCPDESTKKIMGVAKDGIRLGVRIRVTVRANVQKLIGTATDETVRARISEGVVGAVGGVESHKAILAHPEVISEYILSRGLDRGTAFEILSVDVVDITVIDNIGAKLQQIQAETDKQVAQARAEMRRVMAVAKEQEMKAKVMEMNAQVINAEATIPLALAETYSQGTIWRQPAPLIPYSESISWRPYYH